MVIFHSLVYQRVDPPYHPNPLAAAPHGAASLHPGCLPAAVPPRGWNGFAWTHPVLRGPPGEDRTGMTGTQMIGILFV
jgi:hypothetical protein